MATAETIFLLERRTWSDNSLSFPKDPQKHGGTFFSRILVFQAICSLDRAAAMRKPAWMSIDDAHLASSSASIQASLIELPHVSRERVSTAIVSC